VTFIRHETQAQKALEIKANSTEARDQTLGSIQNTTTWSETHQGQYSSAFGDLFLIYDQVAFLTDLATSSNTANTSTLNASVTIDSPEFWDSLDMSGFWSSTEPNLGNAKYDWLPTARMDNPSSLHISWAYTVKTRTDTSLEISQVFMIIVIVFNAMKIYAMYSAFKQCDGDYLITIGDAVASYLQAPECYSKGHCTLSQKELLFELGLLKPNAAEQERLEENGVLYGTKGVWRTSRKRLISSLSSNRGAFASTL
jgi:hypothetical protein